MKLQYINCRYTQVVVLIAQGLCLKEIAVRLGIDRHTVEYHWAQAKNKYALRNYSDATRWAIKRGFVEL